MKAGSCRTVMRRGGQLAADSTVDALLHAFVRRDPTATVKTAGAFLVVAGVARSLYTSGVVHASVRRLQGRRLFSEAIVTEVCGPRIESPAVAS